MGLRKIVGKAIGLTMGLSVLVSVIGATSASAVEAIPKGSYPGTADNPKTGVYADWFLMPERNVYESAAYKYDKQYVCVTYKLWEDNPTYGKSVLDRKQSCGWISSAQTGIHVGDTWMATHCPAGYCFHGMEAQVYITWQLANGYLLGTQTYNYSYDGDYSCMTGSCNRQYDYYGRIWIYAA